MNVLRPIQKEFYGDDYRWFFATVINSHPPFGLEGRIKIRIYGVHNPLTSEIPERDLPWAQVLLPTTEGGVSGLGGIPQLATGSFVFGVFLDGAASQIPLILGSLPRIEFPTSVQSGRELSSTNRFDYDQTRIFNAVILPIKDDDVAIGNVDLRRQQAMKFFIDNGYNLIHSASIVGALEACSSFQTYDTSQDVDTVGIARWKNNIETGSRFSELLKFAAQYSPNSDWRLFSIQLQFVLFELRNRFSLVNSKLLFGTDIASCSAVLNRHYIQGSNSSERQAQRALEEVLS